MSGASAQYVVEAGGSLFVAGSSGGLFRFDLADNTLQPLSKQDGLAGSEVAAMAYDSTTGLLVIGYRDTNVDLLDPRTNQIRNVADIERRTILGEKRIYAITAANGRAYLACSFGIVDLDLRRMEVANTYFNLGRNGAGVRILAVAIKGDSIMAASQEEGVIVGKRTDNLLDYRSWQPVPLPETAIVRSLAVFDGHFFAAQEFKGLFRYGAGAWRRVPAIRETSDFGPLSVMRGLLTVAQPLEPLFSVVRPDLTVFDVAPVGIKRVGQVVAGAGGRYYLADRDQGLLLLPDVNATPTAVTPNGPANDISFSTLNVGADTYGFGGGYNSGTGGFGRLTGFAYRRAGRWESYNARLLPDPARYPVNADLDLTTAAWNPVNEKLYVGSYGNGLIEWSGPTGGFRRFDSSPGSSPLLGPAASAVGTARVTGLAVDEAGVVWVANFNQNPGQPGLFSFDPARSVWTEHLRGQGSELAEKVLIDDNGYKWVSLFPSRATGAYLLVYDERTGRHRALGAGATAGGLAGAVYSMAVDRKGDLWVGTAKGVQVFYNTASVLDASLSVTARQPIIDRRPLLDNITARALVVDGGNRKWIGTSDGLYLVSEDGDKALAHYTAENSPLPSNSVLSLSINGVTGEVLVGTDNGLAALRGAATEPSVEEKPACAVVFPNPVPARFTGQIAIDGLTTGAIVKITDVAGQLVFETKANGGRAVWNARDYAGRRVRTGIYLAYSANSDGQNSCVSKIAVMGE